MHIRVGGDPDRVSSSGSSPLAIASSLDSLLAPTDTSLTSLRSLPSLMEPFEDENAFESEPECLHWQSRSDPSSRVDISAFSSPEVESRPARLRLLLWDSKITGALKISVNSSSHYISYVIRAEVSTILALSLISNGH